MPKINVHDRASWRQASTVTGTDFSHIDLDQAEHIEISDSSVPVADEEAHLRYFCSKGVFKGRLDALLRLARKAGISVIYGVITLNEELSVSDNQDLVDEDDLSLVSIEDAILKFECRFVKSIRVARKYQPPIADGDKMRSTDRKEVSQLEGNFDLVSRTPGGIDKAHSIEFVLFDCPVENAMRKKKVLTDYARNLGLGIKIEMTRYAG